MTQELDIELIDFLDLINETLSYTFVEKWRFRYSEKFVKHFQFKVLHAITNKKQLKLDRLYKYLSAKCKYSPEQVISFFDAIEIDIFKPLIQGKLE